MSALIALINAACLLVIAITMLVRANDLRWKRGLSWRWNARLLGLMLSGFSPVALVLYGTFFPHNPDIAYFQMLFYVGLACVFVTTPGLPPWIKLIFKGDHGFNEHPARRATDLQ